MSFIHYLFLGHFEHEGARVRFTKRSPEDAYRPVVQQPLDRNALQELLIELTHCECGEAAFPEDWPIWLEDGYLVCDKYLRNPTAIQFIARLVEQLHCDLYDVSAHCEINLHDWLTANGNYGGSPASGRPLEEGPPAWARSENPGPAREHQAS